MACKTMKKKKIEEEDGKRMKDEIGNARERESSRREREEWEGK